MAVRLNKRYFIGVRDCWVWVGFGVVRQQVFEWQYVSSYIGCQVLAGAIASRVTLSGSTHQPPPARFGGDTHAHRGVGRHAFRSDQGEPGSGHHPSRSVVWIHLNFVDDDQLRRMRRAMAQMLWSAACLNFLREYGLLEEFELNIETNHATLAGHTMRHELTVAAAAGKLGSVDANRGDELIGWDTDQFPTDLYLAVDVMLVLLGMGGLTHGGLNFDAKRRRESHTPEDLFHAHIGGMDTFARGLKIAAAMRADGRVAEFVKARYSTWDSDLGRKVEQGKASLEELEKVALSQPAPVLASGGQEYLENLVNEFI